jgi:NADH-quinone oxidoreductase subunit J
MVDLGLARIFPAAAAGLAQAGVPLAPLVLLILCVIAGVGTVLLLPSRQEASMRKIGGVILLAAGLIFVALLVRWTAGTAAGGMGAYFWIFATVAIFGAVRVVSHIRPVYSALYFVLTVFATAGLFLLLWAEFMAAALVLIYAGAILVTYVFVIMLAAEATPPNGNGRAGGSGALAGEAEHDTVSRDPVLAAAVGFALMGIMLFVIFDRARPIERVPALPLVGLTPAVALEQELVPTAANPVTPPGPELAGSTQQLGVFLFRNQLVNLQLAGVILTVAMVGAIVIARKHIVTERAEREGRAAELVVPATPVDDNPHSIPVFGTMNPRQKEYPET